MKKPFLIVLFLALFSFVSSQNSVTWNFSTPSIENVDSLFLKIYDSGNQEIFKDFIAVYGTRGDIPTPL